MEINLVPQIAYKFITNFQTKQLPLYELSANIYNTLMKENIIIISNSCKDILNVSQSSMFCKTYHNNLDKFWEIFEDLKNISIKYINDY